MNSINVTLLQSRAAPVQTCLEARAYQVGKSGGIAKLRKLASSCQEQVYIMAAASSSWLTPEDGATVATPHHPPLQVLRTFSLAQCVAIAPRNSTTDPPLLRRADLE